MGCGCSASPCHLEHADDVISLGVHHHHLSLARPVGVEDGLGHGQGTVLHAAVEGLRGGGGGMEGRGEGVRGVGVRGGREG